MDFRRSPNSWQVRALAAHLEIPLEFEFVDITKGESHTPAYLALNPTGRTPTLVDGDFTLWESHAIMQYIAGKTASSLWPDDARARADITRWQAGARALGPGSLGAGADRAVRQEVLNLGPPDEAIVAKGIEAFHKEAACSTPIWRSENISSAIP